MPFNPIALSGGANGVPVLIAATASPGTTIHTATSSTLANVLDKLWVWFTNLDTVARQITVQWGGLTDPNNLICKDYSLPPKSKPVLVVDGLVLQNGLLLKAFASVTNVVTASGHVIQMS